MASTSLKTELSKLQTVLDDPAGFYHEMMNNSDPRVAGWMWMQSPLPTLILIFLYFVMVCFGPKLMKNRNPFDMKPLLFIFNSFIVALNFWMLWEMSFGMLEANYNFICTPMKYSYDPPQLRIANAIWWYYFSKFIEFSDTLFFILRKKNDQVTFLHVYHHASMFFLWWIGVKWVAGGQSVLGAWINCLVHVIMYSYYALSALGPALKPYLWWKQHITHLQLIQFSLAIIHCIHSLYIDCNFPKWMHYTLLGYASSFIALFTNFYINAYIRGKRRGGQSKGPRKGKTRHVVGNGTVKHVIQEEEKKDI